MKTKYYLPALMMCMGLTLASCDDDDVFISTDPIMTADSVVTGSSDVTATSATFHATVKGVENLSPQAYTAGFKWGYTENALTESVSGSLEDGQLTATVNGLTENTVIYYQAYVTLSGKVTYTGAVSKLVTTDATVATADAASIDFAGASLGASVSGAPADATYGIVIAATPDEEAVRAGLIVPAGTEASFAVATAGLAPSTTYYYAGYADLGSGIVYGAVKSFTTRSYDVDVDNDFVDLGLSVKWAKNNVGARNASDLGGYFGYGDVSGVSTSVSVSDYATGDIYKTASDVANRAWNGKVTLPTAADFEELFTLCSKEWTVEDGVAGVRLTGPNGNSIFLPAAGSRTISEVSADGVNGLYATGSINPSDERFAVSFSFGEQGQSRVTTPVYQALSVRPVSTARNVALDLSLLCRTWEIDYNDGETILWNGPVWFYGTDDCWGSVTNNEPIVGDTWLWDADKTNTWAFGDCTGYITFKEDGTVEVKNQNGEVETGKYTVDMAAKTITADVDLLAPDNFKPGFVENRRNAIKILSLTQDGLQLGYFRDADPCTLSVNMVPQAKKYGFEVKLLCVDGNWAGTWGSSLDLLQPATIEGKHTARYEGATDGVMVFTLDFAGLAAAYPNAVVTVTDMRCDGESVKFDASKFRYGDIEDNGNFRVELFNTFGKAADSDGKVDSPFSALVSNSDPAFKFGTSLEIDYVVNTNPTFTPNLITINPSWAGPWDFNQGATMTVSIDKATAMYVIDNQTFDITYTPADVDHSAGSIMTFIQIDGFKSLFPGAHSTLDALVLDGKAVTGYDPAKIYDTNDGDAYRLELWNMYGTSSANGCAFGTAGANGEIAELGFSSSMEVKFTLRSLFPTVAW
ncbi:MAG: hypothetical protein K2G35_05920 [Duncaniella sp.]|nr:hypothetical protein [Duncaniella sp.]